MRAIKIELIDKAELKRQDFQDFSNTDVFYAIDHCPIVDAVPVVRCRDCKHNGEPTCQMSTRDDDGSVACWNDDSDFCSYGERSDKT